MLLLLLLTSSFFTFVNSRIPMEKKYGRFYNSFSVLVTAKNLPGTKSLTLACLVCLFWTLGWGGFFLTKKIFFRGNWWVRPGGLFTNWIMNIVRCIDIVCTTRKPHLKNYLAHWNWKVELGLLGEFMLHKIWFISVMADPVSSCLNDWCAI